MRRTSKQNERANSYKCGTNGADKKYRLGRGSKHVTFNTTQSPFYQSRILFVQNVRWLMIKDCFNFSDRHTIPYTYLNNILYCFIVHTKEALVGEHNAINPTYKDLP